MPTKKEFTKQELFDLLFQEFLKLNDEKDFLITTATTAAQAETVLENWRLANKNQLEMGNKILIENSEELKGIVSDLKKAEKAMDNSLDELKAAAATLDKFNSVLTTISKVVSLGTKLVGLI